MASQAFVEVVADTSNVDRQLATGMERAIRDVENSLPEIDVNAELDLASLQNITRTLDRNIRDIQRSADSIGVDVEVDPAAIAATRARIENLSRQLQSIDLDADVHANLDPAEVVRLRAELARLQARLPDIEIETHVDSDSLQRSFGSLASEASTAGQGAANSLVSGFQGVMSTPAGATAITATAVAAFATIGPAVAALGIGAGVAAIAVSGFADTFTKLMNGQTDKFNEAFAGLSDAAQSVFGELQETLIPVFSGIRDAIETGFFTPLFGRLTELGPKIESLSPALTRVSESMGILADEVLKALTDEGSLQDFNDILDSSAEIIRLLTPLIADALSGAVSGLAGFLHGATSALDGLNKGFDKAYQFGILLGSGLELLKFKFDTLVQGVQNAIQRGVAAFIRFQQSVRQKISEIISNLGTFPGRAVSAISSLGGRLFSAGTSALSRLRAAISSGINSALTVLRGLPGRAVAALGNIGSRLYASGRALIQGLINGITSKIGAMVSAITGALGKARDLFPFSPAKEGPFSGTGYTTFSGAALVEGFIEGIQSQVPALRNALAGSLGTAQIALAPAGASPASMAAGTPAQTISDGMRIGTVNNAAPVVQVMIGNRVINDHIDVRIQQNNQQRDRLGAQGSRR